MPRPLLLICVVVALLVGWWAVVARGRNALVVYCSHDLVYSEAVLREFEHRTGIRVNIVADTEATKSLSLVERLLAERRAPQCDLFWANELLGMEHLAREGLLEPYQGPGFERIPAEFKHPDGLWTGFAGRLRVWITHTPTLAATPATIAARLAEPDLSRFALAKPLYGTTLTQYAVDWQIRGAEPTQAQHRDWVSRGCQIVAGNGTSRDLVARGLCDLGLTDTDDFFGAIDAGSPVAMLPVRIADRTICIPNTVALIRGRRTPAARQLADYLLSAEVEERLANCGSRQIPLGPVDPARLPPEVRDLLPAARESWSLVEMLESYRACRDWLKAEYAR